MGLEGVIRRMMAHHRDDRLPTPQSVMRALLPFVNPTCHFGPVRRNSEPVISLPSVDGIPALARAVPRVLVVDDEELVRRVCLGFFRNENFECAEAGNGAEGLRLLAQRSFDLVLLDIDMPVLNGMEALQRSAPNLRS